MTQIDTKERAALALQVIGEARREKLIGQNADRLSLRWGMSMDAARRYATNLIDEAAPEAVVRVGQVWTQADGRHLPLESILGTGGDGPASYTVEAVHGYMVEVGDGLSINQTLFSGMWLTAWPEHHTLDDPAPQRPAAPVSGDDSAAQDDDGSADGTENLDPRALPVYVSRMGGKPLAPTLPLIGEFYRSVNYRKPEHEPSYVNFLDVVAYLNAHLADYRAGWPDFAELTPQTDLWDYLPDWGGPDDECEVAAAAYLGKWLYDRIRSDVVSEHGGTVDDYFITFPWSTTCTDRLLAAAPHADPTAVLPPDHPLTVCDGQESLL